MNVFSIAPVEASAVPSAEMVRDELSPDATDFSLEMDRVLNKTHAHEEVSILHDLSQEEMPMEAGLAAALLLEKEAVIAAAAMEVELDPDTPGASRGMEPSTKEEGTTRQVPMRSDVGEIGNSKASLLAREEPGPLVRGPTTRTALGDGAGSKSAMELPLVKGHAGGSSNESIAPSREVFLSVSKASEPQDALVRDAKTPLASKPEPAFAPGSESPILTVKSVSGAPTQQSTGVLPPKLETKRSKVSILTDPWCALSGETSNYRPETTAWPEGFLAHGPIQRRPGTRKLLPQPLPPQIPRSILPRILQPILQSILQPILKTLCPGLLPQSRPRSIPT